MCNCRVQQIDCLALTNATLFWRQRRDLDQIVEQNSKYAGLVWREWSLVEKCLLPNYPFWSTPRNSWWGCAARFSKSLPSFRPKNVIFHTRFQTCLWEIMSSLFRLERQQTRFLKILFEFAYFSFFVIYLKLKRQIRSYIPAVSSKTISDSRPKWAKSIPFSDQNGEKTLLFGAANLYTVYIRK